jgi:hypothetical protein
MTPHPVTLTRPSIPPTSQLIAAISIILPLESRLPAPVQVFSRRRESVAASELCRTRPPQRRARWPLSCRASLTRTNGHMRFLSERHTGAMKRVPLFRDDNAADLAAIVGLTVARRRRDAVAASFTGPAYDQGASALGAKGSRFIVTSPMRPASLGYGRVERTGNTLPGTARAGAACTAPIGVATDLAAPRDGYTHE